MAYKYTNDTRGFFHGYTPIDDHISKCVLDPDWEMEYFEMYSDLDLYFAKEEVIRSELLGALYGEEK